ncbi:MAG: hypothetical protein DWQ06_09925 [Calditrichaeota bacterium]|nr:MAG: hypothetical protein DWQ06_09925 [Calditrichota bacterium]
MKKKKLFTGQQGIVIAYVILILLPLITSFYLAQQDTEALVLNSFERTMKIVNSTQFADKTFNNWTSKLRKIEHKIQPELFELASIFDKRSKDSSREIYPTIAQKVVALQKENERIFVNCAYFDKNGYILNIQTNEVSDLKLVEPKYYALESVKIFDNFVDCRWDSEFVAINGEFTPFEELSFDKILSQNKSPLNDIWSAGNFHRYSAMEVFHKLDVLRIGFKIFDAKGNIRGIFLGDIEKTYFSKVFDEINSETFDVNFISNEIFEFEREKKFPYTYILHPNSGFYLRFKLNTDSLFEYGITRNGIFLTVFLVFLSVFFFSFVFYYFRQFNVFISFVLNYSTKIINEKEEPAKITDNFKNILYNLRKAIEIFIPDSQTEKLKEALRKVRDNSSK